MRRPKYWSFSFTATRSPHSEKPAHCNQEYSRSMQMKYATLRPQAPELLLHTKRSHRNEKPSHRS